MAIRTDRAYAGTIRMVNGWNVFLVYVVFHLMTANTKFQLVGSLHGGVETAPENDASDEKYQCTGNRCTPQDAT